MADKTTFKSFFADVVIPAAEAAKQWKTEQYKASISDAVDLFTAGQMDKAVFLEIAVKLSNTSALRQDLEKAGVIPAKTASNWLSALTKE